MRGRNRIQSYGGADIIDLGRFEANSAINVPRPNFDFGPQAHDRVRQRSLGVAYQGRFGDTGTVGVALQRTHYRKRSRYPGLSPITSVASPWLPSVAGTLTVTPGISLYGSYAEGLEESEPAPDNAANRGEPVPAIRTRQLDAGLRWQLAPGLSAVAGAFQLEKPYFSLDSHDRYVRLGTIRNRGLELSLAGALSPRLTIVTGTLFQDPEVVGRTAEPGSVGSRPVGLLRRISTVDLDWQTPVPGLSLDLSVASRSREVSTTDNRTWIPARTRFSVGGRYRFRLADSNAVLRLTLNNLTDVRGHVSRGPGAYGPLEGRLLSGYLTLDF